MSNDPYGIASPAQLRHALRTPLNHIIGYAEMISEALRDEVTPGQSQWALPSLDAVLFNSRELVRFVQNALPGSRLELIDRDVTDLQQWLHPHVVDLIADIGVLRDIDAEHVHDVQRIESAAQRLLAFTNGLPEALTETVGPQEEVRTAGREGLLGHLLVVDDNAQNRDILRRSLERGGYQVDLAENGASALERLKAGGFDLILLDVLMPVMNGYDLLREVKAEDRLKEVPVIMISALDESSAVVRCIQMGAEDYIMKPFDPVLVRTRVSAALDRSRARQQLGRVREELAELVETEAGAPAQEILMRVKAIASAI